jgi:hypothetical protein
MPAVVVTLLLALPGQPTNVELLDQSERAFAEGLAQRERGDRGTGAFRRAAARLDELRRRGVVNAALLRDLGNAHFLAGDLPRAILAYRQGLRLSPGDRGLREGLAFAREQVGYPDGSALGRPRDDARPPWLPAPDGRSAFVLAALAYVAGCVCVTRARMQRRAGWLSAGAILLISAVAGGALILWRGPPAPLAVLARDGVLLRKGDGEAFPPWYDTGLNRGVEAAVLFRRGDWLQVELAGGEVGWVHARDVVTD